MCLSNSHQYYYQVQTQLGVCKLERAFFVVWTLQDLHIEEVLFDDKFWGEICAKSLHIFKTAILPELVGKDVEYGEMVACVSNECRYEWFHFNCVGVKSVPKGQWFCPDCRKLRNLKRKKTKHS
ncbi:YNG2-like protein [Mya arenaria]|uniref:YNG2-like protein n=1 Tax=Mya arenaria TaxID=6604 RepID=A0ABY7DC23_MYAAR|nr:YNG2-like protein [Mya arenaria]